MSSKMLWLNSSGGVLLSPLPEGLVYYSCDLLNSANVSRSLNENSRTPATKEQKWELQCWFIKMK